MTIEQLEKLLLQFWQEAQAKQQAFRRAALLAPRREQETVRQIAHRYAVDILCQLREVDDED